MINVWTVLRGGDFRYRTNGAESNETKIVDRRYTPGEVISFQRMVKRYLPDCRFRCLSIYDIPGVDVIPLAQPDTLLGWWAKMELFRPDLPAGRNLYFDLDTVIVGGVQEIAEFPARFACAKPGAFVGPVRTKRLLDQEGRWRVPGYQTSVMVWNSDAGHRFWEAFEPDQMARLASDQDWLKEFFPKEDCLPAEWFSRIRHCKDGPWPGLKVVLTGPYRNDGAAWRYPWIAGIWGKPENEPAPPYIELSERRTGRRPRLDRRRRR